ASVKSHFSKVERRRSLFLRFVRTKSHSQNRDARRSLPERSASVKLTRLKSFQQRLDSDKSVFLNETGPTSDLPKKVRGRVRFSRSCSPAPSLVRKKQTPSGSSSSHWGRWSGMGGITPSAPASGYPRRCSSLQDSSYESRLAPELMFNLQSLPDNLHQHPF